MNRALPEMLHCQNGPATGTDMTVLERQGARMKWQPQEQQGYFGGSDQFTGLFLEPGQVGSFQGLLGGESVLGEVLTRSVKPDPGLENGWPELVNMGFTEFDMNCAISRTSSCPPTVAPPPPEAKGKVSPPAERVSSAVGRESFKKRKADKLQNTKVVAEDDSKDKRSKVCAEEGESKITEQTSNKDNNRETSADTSKENSKASEAQKPDYIHVRARRGQATDSHSLAERVRREKISERMKYLQDLVPGCNKITGKAGMLDEIINYVQSLHRQVEFLSMKLAGLNPQLEINTDNFEKEFPAYITSFPTATRPSAVANLPSLQLNPVQQGNTSCELDVLISSSATLPELYPDSSSFSKVQSFPTWESGLPRPYNVGFH